MASGTPTKSSARTNKPMGGPYEGKARLLGTNVLKPSLVADMEADIVVLRQTHIRGPGTQAKRVPECQQVSIYWFLFFFLFVFVK